MTAAEATARYTAKNLSKVRAAKRDQMARRRADPVINEAMNAARRTPAAHARDKAWRDRIRDRHFFRHRARIWSNRHKIKVTTIQLAGLWIRQRGRCALTDDRLDASAVLDHVVSQSRGGSSTIENLQWTTSAANMAKGDLSSQEFVDLCRAVVAQSDRLAS